MRQLSIYSLILFTMLMLTNCHCSKITAKATPIEQNAIWTVSAATPPALVYKTRKDYSHYVPVTMNEEKTMIVSYPDPTDIYYKGKLAYPTLLIKGYLLDNRGIGPNVAFLDYTYEAYNRLKVSLTVEQLISHLLDKYPLLELWNCGSRPGFKDEVKELNILIEKGFPGCIQQVKEYKVELNQ